LGGRGFKKASRESFGGEHTLGEQDAVTDLKWIKSGKGTRRWVDRQMARARRTSKRRDIRKETFSTIIMVGAATSTESQGYLQSQGYKKGRAQEYPFR